MTTSTMRVDPACRSSAANGSTGQPGDEPLNTRSSLAGADGSNASSSRPHVPEDPGSSHVPSGTTTTSAPRARGSRSTRRCQVLILALGPTCPRVEGTDAARRSTVADLRSQTR
jgi:hypothetical protein